MIIRNNDATTNRPEGDRILDAPYVFINMPDYLRMIKEEKAWILNDRNSITVFKGNGLTLVLTALKQGALLDKIQTDGFMALQLLEGLITINTPDGNMDMQLNQIMVFHPSIQYSVTASEECSFLLSHYNSFGDGGNII
ncbi:MAG: hypothetical protein JWM28_4096 [Chitinophagaceae bacterium]|nr:hypothetical protein [Chitinophagaceae bacterium]